MELYSYPFYRVGAATHQLILVLDYRFKAPVHLAQLKLHPSSRCFTYLKLCFTMHMHLRYTPYIIQLYISNLSIQER